MSNYKDKFESLKEIKRGEIMCSVGDGFNVEIGEDVKLGEYVCKDCGKEFKGIGRVKCPACKSLNTGPKENTNQKN